MRNAHPAQSTGPLTLAVIAQRFRSLRVACDEGDESDVRAELRLLAADASVLAASEPLPLLAHRLTLADRQRQFVARPQGGGMGC